MNSIYYNDDLKCSGTDLNDPLHHAHHLVNNSDDLVRSLRRRHVRPIRWRQHESTSHVQDIGGREFEVDRGAVGVVDDG